MIVKLLTEHHLEFLSLKGGCRGWSKSTHVKMPHCWKPHVAAHIFEALESTTGLGILLWYLNTHLQYSKQSKFINIAALYFYC